MTEEEAKTSKHTPGPWSVGTRGDGTPGYVYCDNELGSAVAIVYGKPLEYTVFSRAEEIANARLIAAAPDLLEALRYYASPETWTINQVEGPDGDYGAKARAAIAKATGEA